MSKYIDDECRDCYEHIEPYGCTWHDCPIYKAVKEYHTDREYDSLKDDGKINSIFDGILDTIKGDI